MIGALGSSGFDLLAVIVVAAAIIWLIYDILQRRDMSIGVKVLWMVLSILFSIVTLIVYVLFFRKRSVSQR